MLSDNVSSTRQKFTEANAKYTELVKQWADADRKCQDAYVIWQHANAHREHLARAKREAWLALSEAMETVVNE